MTDFDVVIIGSGFGGSVMAKELAEGGKKVCLLERGKAYAPGDFPRSPAELSKAFWDPSERLHGMFNVWSFEKFGALISSGLGGGSLIYANVFLRKPREWFEEKAADGTTVKWPIDYDRIEKSYDRVEKIIGVQEIPYDIETHALTSKGNALRQAANELGLKWKKAPLAVTFGKKDEPLGVEIEDKDNENFHGRLRVTCRMCGECDIGCNYGAKNTLDHTYLSKAKRAGADIRTRHEVKSIAKEANQFIVEYVVHRDGVSSSELVLERMTCKRLVLSAGALGSTFLMLRNWQKLGLASKPKMLGEKFCTNGDLLTLVTRAKTKQGFRKLDPSRGPVIMSYVEGPDQPNHRNFFIQDAGIPDILAWVVNTVGIATNLKRAVTLLKTVFANWTKPDVDRDLSAEVSAFLGDTELATSSIPLLGMGRDQPNGRMSLSVNSKLQVSWRASQSGDFFPNLRETMKDIAGKLGGEFRDAPIWNFGRVITVHPLGGCPMGKTAKDGVVDEAGEVFGVKNLYIADGSVLPGPVGPNPAFTIAAVADLFAQAMLKNWDSSQSQSHEARETQ